MQEELEGEKIEGSLSVIAQTLTWARRHFTESRETSDVTELLTSTTYRHLFLVQLVSVWYSNK